jgi:hypothetical protein
LNTFAYLLLAFPFYLAINGRLTAYTSLASSQTKSTGSATGGAPSAPGSLGASANLLQDFQNWTGIDVSGIGSGG